MTGYRLVVVSGGLGQPSSTRLLADRLGAATQEAARASGQRVSVEVVELRPLARDLANLAISGLAGPDLRAAIEAVAAADGAIMVTPIYNGSFSGLFTLFVDAVEPDAWEGLPVLLGATAGTARHALALEFAVRPLFATLRARTVPTGVFAAAKDWASRGRLAGRMAQAGTELIHEVTARPAADPYEEPVPFAKLLASP